MAGLLEAVEPLSPPLKWAGGKRWLAPHLYPLWRRHCSRRLVEPFCGGLAVTLGLLPDRAILNDINPHAVNFYRWIQAGLRITIDTSNDPATYYKHRTRFNELIRTSHHTSCEAAQLFYYLNRTGYNGLCRFNSAGGFNVPFGKYTKINYATDFFGLKEQFTRWTFSCGDFEGIDRLSTDFIYADPPYDVPFTQYSKEPFSWEDQVRLANWLARHDGPVALSNQATPRIVKLYQDLGFKLVYYDAPRRISCNGDRTAAKEVLAIRGV